MWAWILFSFGFSVQKIQDKILDQEDQDRIFWIFGFEFSDVDIVRNPKTHPRPNLFLVQTSD